MVFLKDLPQQWPWANTDMNLQDKEILTIRIDPDEYEKHQKTWKIPLYAPMPGYAFVGVRMVIESKEEYIVSGQLSVGEREKSFFGSPWDKIVLSNRQWTPLPFPLTNRMIAMDEDGISITIYHDSPKIGKVECIAQRFDDILENETNYAFWDNQKNSVLRILTKSGYFYRPLREAEDTFPQAIKLIPPIASLLSSKWNQDSSYTLNLPYENTLQIESLISISCGK